VRGHLRSKRADAGQQQARSLPVTRRLLQGMSRLTWRLAGMVDARLRQSPRLVYPLARP
jgi:hypothetical protein